MNKVEKVANKKKVPYRRRCKTPTKGELTLTNAMNYPQYANFKLLNIIIYEFSCYPLNWTNSDSTDICWGVVNTKKSATTTHF
ncbi:hypothetical protein HQN90_12940 [Paenibacillus alba]|nr:hypothetical protein [Paenibacillus alba]